MSDSVVKLRIDSKEYDANIKRAGQALTDYFNKVKEGGGTLMHLDEGVMEAVKVMGELGTKADNTKGALRELTQATTDMTVAYRSLTDEEKNSPLGQEMQKSIQQLTERAGNMRDAMDDVQASINNAASDTRVFDQIAGGAQLMTAGFQSAVGAMKLFGVETDNNVEVLAQLQAAMGVVNGLQTIQTALQKQSAVMQGVQAVQAAAAAAAQTSLAGATGAATVAQKAFNLVANANPYVLLATAVAAVGTALYAFASASSKAKQEAEELAKAEEAAAKKADESRQSFVNASADAMNSASRLSSLQVAYKNANSEIEKTDILKQAQQEFKKLGFECNGLNDAQTLLIKNGAKVIELIQLQGNAAAVSAVRMEKFKESFKMLMENGYSASAAATLAGYNKDVQELDGQLTTIQSRIQNLKGGLGVGSKGGSGSGRGSKSTATVEKDEMSLNSQKITDLTNEYIKATDERRQAIEKEIATLQKRNEEIQKLKDMAQGKAFDAGQLNGEAVVTGRKSVANDKAFREAPTNFDSINTWINGVKDQLKNANLGDELYNSLTEKMKDATTMSTLLNELMERGINGSDLTSVAEKMKAALLEGDIPDDKIKEFIDQLNEKIKEQGGIELSYNGQTGEVSDKKGKEEDDGFKKFNEGIGKLTGGLSSVSSGLKALGVDVPKEVDQMIGVINGASQVISGIGTIISLFGAGAMTANTTAVGLNTAAIGGLIAALEFNTATNFIPFAGGGVVGRAAGGLLVGNHMSGDNLRLPVNSGGFIGINDGELILNKAQQGNLASQLEGSRGAGGESQPYVLGEQIYLGLKAYMLRSGMGEIVTSRR